MAIPHSSSEARRSPAPISPAVYEICCHWVPWVLRCSEQTGWSKTWNIRSPRTNASARVPHALPILPRKNDTMSWRLRMATTVPKSTRPIWDINTPITKITTLHRKPDTHSTACMSDILRIRFMVQAVASALVFEYFPIITRAPGNILTISSPANRSVRFSVHTASNSCILTAIPRSGLERTMPTLTDTTLSTITISPIRKSSHRMIVTAAPPISSGLIIRWWPLAREFFIFSTLKHNFCMESAVWCPSKYGMGRRCKWVITRRRSLCIIRLIWYI